MNSSTVRFKFMDVINDPSLLPNDAESGHAYVHGKDVYVFNGTSWDKGPSPIRTPAPLEYLHACLDPVNAWRYTPEPSELTEAITNEALCKMFQDMIEADFMKAVNTSDPDFDLDRYAERNKALVDEHWKKALERAFSKRKQS